MAENMAERSEPAGMRFLVREPLDIGLLEAVLRSWSARSDVGAHACFLGQVRSDPLANGVVRAIEYSAEPVLAERALAEIRDRALRDYGCLDVWIRHSVGVVPAGSVGFMVAVAAVHRGAAFEALPAIVDAVKADVPIYGKELGEEGYRWKVNT